jgi:hypothetical protein
VALREIAFCGNCGRNVPVFVPTAALEMPATDLILSIRQLIAVDFDSQIF